MPERRKQNPEQTANKRQTLKELYQEAEERDLFIREFKTPRGFMAAVGDFLPLLERGADPNDLTIASLVENTLPGIGETREEAVRNAIDSYDDFIKEENEKQL